MELCLKSVESAIENIDAEIIVVDNNSKDGSCNMVKTLFPKVKVIANNKNHGFSKGNNIGVSQAQGEYLCILNPDTVVSEDTFFKLLKFAKTRIISELLVVSLLMEGVHFYLKVSVKFLMLKQPLRS